MLQELGGIEYVKRGERLRSRRLRQVLVRPGLARRGGGGPGDERDVVTRQGVGDCYSLVWTGGTSSVPSQLS